MSYAGPAEWSYRRMVLHYAHLCAAAGGVDAFLIGPELKALTQVRSGPATYPAVTALKTLAARMLRNGLCANVSNNSRTSCDNRSAAWGGERKNGILLWVP